MNIRFGEILPILFILFPHHSTAQNNVQHNNAIDAYVQKLGKLDTLNMGTLATLVTKPFSDKKDKARAIFDWIAFNISFDLKAARSGSAQKNSTTEVLQYRKASSSGFASLFQDMCSSVNIRCLIPDGFVKVNAEQIEETKPEINHTWAVVQLGQSPEEWFYVDPAWGSGYADAEMKTFTLSFNDAYFFADKNIFNMQHYPDNEGWKLGPAPKTKKDFFSLPMVKSAAYELKLQGLYPIAGRIKTRVNQVLYILIKMDSAASISKVTLVKGDRKKQKEEDVINSFDKGLLKITCKFVDEGTYPATVKINGKELVTYLVEVE